MDIPRAVAKIHKDHSKAVLVVPMGCTEEDSTRDWVVSLTNMTLNKVVLLAGESVYQDAKGQPMPTPDSPSAASSCGPGDPPILSERSWSTSNTFLVAKDDWVQGLVLSPGTLVGHEDPPRAVIPPALALTKPLRLFFLSRVVSGLPLGECPGESTIPDVDGAALTTSPPCDGPRWGPWLQGLR